YLARYKGQSRIHTDCDLRAYFRWCAERRVDPLNTSRPYLELSTCAGCKKNVATRRAPPPAGCPPWPASTAPASSTACSRPPRRPRTPPTGHHLAGGPEFCELGAANFAKTLLWRWREILPQGPPYPMGPRLQPSISRATPGRRKSSPGPPPTPRSRRAT